MVKPKIRIISNLYSLHLVIASTVAQAKQGKYQTIQTLYSNSQIYSPFRGTVQSKSLGLLSAGVKGSANDTVSAGRVQVEVRGTTLADGLGRKTVTALASETR